MIAPSYPLLLRLPDGDAHYVGLIDDRPRYERDGVLIGVDVTIPPDLIGRWCWHGSFLVATARPCGWLIDTRSFPPPECFAIARRHVQRERALAATVVQLRMW